MSTCNLKRTLQGGHIKFYTHIPSDMLRHVDKCQQKQQLLAQLMTTSGRQPATIVQLLVTRC